MPITILDPDTVNQIAAGEVIERPSSVVKELLENAIDAGATAVTIEIKDGGISFLRITDNGAGIPRDEIPLAFTSHATSKISSAEDLLTVSSLGFRGEALSSIAAVARVELITKAGNSLTGSRYVIEGGEEKSLEEIGAPNGTTFVVRDLFYNVPARRKFLKTAQTEGSYISALAERIALSHPEIAVRLLINGSLRLHTSGNGRLQDIIYTVYGREIHSGLLPVDMERDGLAVHGFLGRPLISRGNRSYENYFINGRYIKSPLITRAIENAYHGFVMQHKYPFTALHLTIPQEELDVNVHPAKMELRFRNEEQVYQAVYEVLRAVITGKELIPEVGIGREEREKKEEAPRGRGPEPFEERRREMVREESHYEPSTFDLLRKRQEAAAEHFPNSAKEPAQVSGREEYHEAHAEEIPTEEIPAQAPIHGEPSGPAEPDPVIRAEEINQPDLFGEKILSPRARSRYRLIGQLFDTYWLVEYQDRFLMIDQHAAHEKVLYEKAMRQLAEKEHTCQQIHPPIILTLSAREEQVLAEHGDKFASIGFEIEPFGGKEYAVRGVPANLYSIAERDLLTELLDSLAGDGSGESALVEEKVALMSCKAAVKGNNRLSFEEADALIDELLALEHPYTCPHGRPTIISMTKYEVEKKFKRIVT